MSDQLDSSKQYLVEIRDRNRSDDPAITDIANRQLRLAWKKNTVHHQLKNQFRYMVVATIDGMVVGFVQYSLQRNSRLDVEILAVHPEWTGCGVGTAMMQNICNMPAKTISVTCEEDNVGMQMIIGRLNFWKESLIQRNGRRYAVFMRTKV